jgi:hypothetical protein
MPQFVNQISGRFGNSIFRYLASVVMCIVYDGQLAYEPQNATHIVTDDFFLRWMTRLLDDNVAEDIDGDFFEKGTSRAVFNATHTARQMKIQENAYKHLLNYIAAGGEPKVNNLYIYKNAEGRQSRRSETRARPRRTAERPPRAPNASLCADTSSSTGYTRSFATESSGGYRPTRPTSSSATTSSSL